jgi:hypothetical protein
MYIQQPKQRAETEVLEVNDPSIDVYEGKHKKAQASSCAHLKRQASTLSLLGTSYHVISTSTPLSHPHPDISTWAPSVRIGHRRGGTENGKSSNGPY